MRSPIVQWLAPVTHHTTSFDGIGQRDRPAGNIPSIAKDWVVGSVRLVNRARVQQERGAEPKILFYWHGRGTSFCPRPATEFNTHTGNTVKVVRAASGFQSQEACRSGERESMQYMKKKKAPLRWLRLYHPLFVIR